MNNLDSPLQLIVLEPISSSIVILSMINGFSICPSSGFSNNTSRTIFCKFSTSFIDQEITKSFESTRCAEMLISASSISPAFIKNKNMRKTEINFLDFIQIPQFLSTYLQQPVFA